MNKVEEEVKEVKEEDISAINEKAEYYGGDDIFSGMNATKELDQVKIEVEAKTENINPDLEIKIVVDVENKEEGCSCDQSSFLEEFNLPCVNGAKSNGSNSENFHRHHIKLSKVITDLRDRIVKIEYFERLVKMQFPDYYWNRLSKHLDKIIEQEQTIEQEQRKLEVLKGCDLLDVLYPIRKH